jgi:RecA-family ATPase
MQLVQDLADGPEEPAAVPAASKFSTLELDGLTAIDTASAMRSPRPIADYVIPGLLSGSIAVMVGPGGVSKSMLALQTAGIIASGADHWHLWTDGTDPIKSGRVAVFNIEDPGIILDTRCHDIAASLPGHMREQFIDEYHDQVSIWPLVGRGFAFGRKAPKTGQIRPTEWIDWISEKVEGTRLAVVDTFIRGLDGLDENASTEVAPVLAMLEIVARKTACTFLILHHTNKASTAPGQAAAQGAARGSSAITDNARWQTNLSTMTEAESQTRGITDERKRWVQVELAKVNYGPPLESRWLYRGDGGVLTGSTQPPKPQAKQASGKATGKGDGGAAYAAASGSFSPYVDPRRRPRHHVADDIDLQIPGEL